MKGFYYALSVFLLFSTLSALFMLNEEFDWMGFESKEINLNALRVNSAFEAREKIVREAYEINLGVESDNESFTITGNYPFNSGFLTDLNYSIVNCSINGSEFAIGTNSYYYAGGNAWNASIIIQGELPALEWDYSSFGAEGKQFDLIVSNESHSISDSRAITGASRLLLNRSGSVIVEVGVWPGLQANFSTACTAEFKVLNNDSIMFCNEVSTWFNEVQRKGRARVT